MQVIVSSNLERKLIKIIWSCNKINEIARIPITKNIFRPPTIIGQLMNIKIKNPSPLYKDDGLNNSCFCDPVWIRTKDLLLRRQLLYPAELQDPFKTEQFHNFFLYRKNVVGVARFELATSWSQTRRDNRATLHPDTLKNFCSLLKGLASRYSTHLKLVRYTGSIS